MQIKTEKIRRLTARIVTKEVNNIYTLQMFVSLWYNKRKNG